MLNIGDRYGLEHSGGYPTFDGRSLIIYADGGVRVKHAGKEYGKGAWPAGTSHIRSALKELLK